jgi:hypothetical protein
MACFRVQVGAAEVWRPRHEENFQTVKRSCGRPRYCSQSNTRLTRRAVVDTCNGISDLRLLHLQLPKI